MKQCRLTLRDMIQAEPLHMKMAITSALRNKGFDYKRSLSYYKDPITKEYVFFQGGKE